MFIPRDLKIEHREIHWKPLLQRNRIVSPEFQAFLIAFHRRKGYFLGRGDTPVARRGQEGFHEPSAPAYST